MVLHLNSQAYKLGFIQFLKQNWRQDFQKNKGFSDQNTQ